MENLGRTLLRVRARIVYRKPGTGYDWAGHSSVTLDLRRDSIVRLLSPDVSLGDTLPTGSTQNISFLFYIFVQLKSGKRMLEIAEMFICRGQGKA